MNLMDQIKNVNDAINGFVWGGFGIVLLLGTGLTCTIITKCLQIFRLPHVCIFLHIQVCFRAKSTRGRDCRLGS